MMSNANSFVAVLMGSDSDLVTMQGCMDVLAKLDVPCEVHITSAHRTPDVTRSYVIDAVERGCSVFIAAAGMAAHLAGAVAAQTPSAGKLPDIRSANRSDACRSDRRSWDPDPLEFSGRGDQG